MGAIRSTPWFIPQISQRPSSTGSQPIEPKILWDILTIKLKNIYTLGSACYTSIARNTATKHVSCQGWILRAPALFSLLPWPRGGSAADLVHVWAMERFWDYVTAYIVDKGILRGVLEVVQSRWDCRELFDNEMPLACFNHTPWFHPQWSELEFMTFWSKMTDPL